MIGQRALLTAVAVGGVACLALAFLSSSGRLPPPLSVGIALGLPLAGAVAMSWRSRLRWPVAVAALALLGAAALHIDELSRHVSALWFLQHVAGHALLAVFFGRTLLPGAEPLATRIARAVLPSMPPEVVRYSRGVTLAWTIYFAVMTMVSVVLYFGSSIQVWSTFATLISGPLVALMFVLEFMLRRRMVPATHWATIAQTVTGFRALMRAPSTRGPHA